MSSSESSNCSSSDSDSSDTSHDERSYRSKTFAEKRLRHINYFYDKFGMCQKCQDIYWEMRHTWNDADGGSFYEYEWHNDERYQVYGNEMQEMLGHKEIKRQYWETLLNCKDCPRNKDTPCSLKDQAYSCISQTIGKHAIAEMQKNSSFYLKVNYIDHKVYNRRVSKLDILNCMIKDLEAKPCKWECSHFRQLCSPLVSFKY